MKVLILSKEPEEAKYYSKEKRIKREELEKTLEYESVIAIGDAEELVDLVRSLRSPHWHRLFLCETGNCLNEFVYKLAKRGDRWEYAYSLKFKSKKFEGRKVTRKELLRGAFSTLMESRWVGIPKHYTSFAYVKCKSPYCKVCKEVCPTNAIRLREGKVTVDPDQCDGCGKCVTACPLRSLYLPGLDERGLLQALETPGTSTYLEKIIFTTPESIKEEYFGERRAVILWNTEVVDEDFAKFLYNEYGIEVCYDDKCISEKVEEIGCKEINVISDPLIRGLRKYGLGGKYFVKIDRNICDLCNKCVNVCPTKALESKHVGPNAGAIFFVPSRCVGCRACTTACPPQQYLEKIGLRNIKVIDVIDAFTINCGEVELVSKVTAKFKCFLCGKKLVPGMETEISEEQLGMYYVTLVQNTKQYLKLFDEINDKVIEGLFENVGSILTPLVCSKCRDVLMEVWNAEVSEEKREKLTFIKKKILETAILYASCLHREMNVVPQDPLEDESIRKLLGDQTIRDPCEEWRKRSTMFDWEEAVRRVL